MTESVMVRDWIAATGGEKGDSSDMVTSKTMYKQTQGMQGGTWVYEMFIATGEKVSLYISIEDWRLSVLEKVVGNSQLSLNG